MKVTEKDIFNFVFFPHLVREEVKSFLFSIENSNDIIEFYKNLKSSISKELPISIKKKLAAKLAFYKPDNIINLYPAEEIKKKTNLTVLAAASSQETPKIITKTFYDAEKTYIIKVINYSDHSKIFVFSTQQEVIKDFDIVILPENKQYHCNDNSVPLELNSRILAESIQIKFNLNAV